MVRSIRENLRFIRDCLLHLNKKQETFSLHPEPHNKDLRIRRAEETYHSIVKLKRMHTIIYDSTSLVNDLIRIPMFVLMIFVVFSSISGGYKVFLAFKGDILLERVAGKKTKKKLLVYHLLSLIYTFLVPICSMYTCSITLSTLIFSCSSTYNTIDEILREIHSFEFKKFDRDAGLSLIVLEFAIQIVQRPIEFNVGGFCCLSQPLLATVSIVVKC